MNNKQKLMIIGVICLAVIILTGASYALLRSSDKGSNTYTMNIGNLEVSFVDENTKNLNLSNMYPMTDNEGLSQSNELEFTIKNTGNSNARYEVYIDETSTNPAFKDYIRFAVNKNNEGYGEPTGVANGYLYIDRNQDIEVLEEVNYKVKVWLGVDADSTYMGKTFTGRIVVEALQENAVIVDFDANGGTVDTLSKKVLYHDTYGELPIPIREGYTFMGWNGKNLLNLDVEESFPSDRTNWDNTVNRIFTPNTYVIGMSNNNYYVPTCIYQYNISANSIIMSATSGYGIAYPLKLKALKQYALSYNIEFDGDGNFFRVSITHYTIDGEYIGSSYVSNDFSENKSLINVIPLNSYYTLIIFSEGDNSNANNIGTFSNIQLEEGSVATEYEPYYITSNTTVVQNQNHTLKAIWKENS